MSTKTEVVRTTQRKYGLISMLSMIVGIVIGSGIFFKNQGIFAGTQSTILTMTVWFIISVIVILMIISFMEISSSTKKKGDTGSVSNWGTHFIGPKTGKLIGFFFVYLYMPVIFVILSIVFAEQIIAGLQISTNVGLDWNSWITYLVITGVAFGLFCLVALINSLTRKPGKALQIMGTGVKLVPLFAVVFVVFSLMFYSTNDYMDVAKDMWNPDNQIYNYGIEQAENTFGIMKIIVLALPGVMFSFDGFVFAAAVQNEAKTKNTFRNALALGMIFVIVIYLATTFFVFVGADWSGYDPNDPSFGFLSIQSVLANVLPDASSWLPLTMALIIGVSVLTSISGTFIASTRSMSSLSEKNYIVDENGKYLKRNKALVPAASGAAIFWITVLWFVILRGLDAVLINELIKENPNSNNNTFAISDYASSIVTIFSFTSYALLLIAMFFNRFTKKVDVDKVRFASIFGLISGIVIIGISLTFAYSILEPPTTQELQKTSVLYTYWISVSLFAFSLLLLLLVYYFNSRKVKRTMPSVFARKQKYINSFIKVEKWNEEFERDIQVLPHQFN